VREHFDSVGCGTIYKTAGEGRVPLTAAQPAPVQQEPVAWGVFEGGNLHDMFFTREEADNMAHLKGLHAEIRPLTTPPAAQRQWVGLTQQEVQEIHDTYHKRMGPQEFAAILEAKLKEKNT
jgi:hypothetical protein